jgi:hypothetical protein
MNKIHRSNSAHTFSRLVSHFLFSFSAQKAPSDMASPSSAMSIDSHPAQRRKESPSRTPLFKSSLRRVPSEILQPFVGLSRYIKVLLVVYISVSLVYTLVHFYTLFRFGPMAVGNERTVVGKIVLDESSDALWTGRFSVMTESGEID